MKLKRKKSAMLIMLSLILSTTSCKQNNSYKDDHYNTIEEIMDNNPFYQEYDLSKTYKQKYLPFYYSYLNKFADYLDKEQYATFLKIISEMDENEIDDHNYNKTFSYLNEIMNFEKDQYGRGIYHAFNNQIIKENIDYFYDYGLNTEIYKEINTLRSIVNNDQTFFSSLFSKDINKFIECVQKNTGMENKDLIGTLIINMDLYSDIESSKEIMDIELRESYGRQISNIMGILVKSKLETDPKFADTLYGKILKNSKYIKEDYISEAFQELLENETNFHFFSENYDIDYDFSLSSEYLYSHISFSELKELKVTKIIDQADKEDNSDYSDTMTFMIHLIDPEILIYTKNSASTIRKIMYEDLKKHFKNIEDFDEYFLIFDCYPLDYPLETIKIWDIYFNILNLRIKEGGITIDDFSRYTSLVNCINDHRFTSYDWNLDVKYPPIEEIKSLPKEEAEEIVGALHHDRLFRLDSKLTMIENTLKSNNLGYEMVYNPNCKFEYNYRIVIVNDDSNCVISKSVEPKNGKYNGMDIIYYEIPEYFEEGRAITTFKNIEDKFTIKEVEGFKETFFDEMSQREVTGFIVKINTNQKKEYQPIRFMEYYMHYEEKRSPQNKELTLGAKQ